MTTTTIPVRRGKRRFKPMQVFSILLLLLGLFFLAWWILQLVMASPLQPVESGHHDFGVVLIDAPKSVVEHTFVLVNTSDEPVRILKTVPSCGCTWAGPGEPFLEPGQRMELPVTLSVKESHKLDSNIKVVLENHSPLVLWLSARGRMRDSLRHTPRSISIRRPSEGTLGIKQSNARLYVEGWGDARPPTPVFDAPEGLTIEFQGWRLTKQGVHRLGTPNLYEGEVLVKSTGAPPERTEIPVTMPDGQVTTLLVNGDAGFRGMGIDDKSWIPDVPDITFDPEVPVGEPDSD
ncbi:MAG: DUF1573 domain-containing protein [Phycisphaerales bacterium]|jgi:hypothetical protein|nr:DUF1573 domain-containing protein [Phycisphaerales bacterium]